MRRCERGAQNACAPLTKELLTLLPDNRVRLELKRPFRDGTYALEMDVLYLSARLATCSRPGLAIAFIPSLPSPPTTPRCIGCATRRPPSSTMGRKVALPTGLVRDRRGVAWTASRDSTGEPMDITSHRNWRAR